MESVTNKARTIARRRHSRLSLTWIDFLVIAAIILTFAVIVSTTVSRARASTHNGVSSPEFSSDVSQIPDDPGLIKAKIRLAAGGPWG
jgi:hypothetical protein